ncbi:hypothetical protein [Streptomyces diastatochromogenes]|uniref:hypothetical protein n=1 Tax=Streptomyces diastatochromogenes TaxID=42236 RepID=UPI001181611B|nr:hypothetical protein [Streptomyces diastatochromogenes]MCZ0989012.1 hypothetical protein [Streptomyces diastatochromogenes]
MAATGADRTSTTGRRGVRPLQWAAASLVTLAAAAAVVVFFTTEVCDQQMASNGTVVRVCRHPQMTDPPMVVLGLVILVLLGVFFSEISGFGITLKRQVEEARSAAQEAIRETREVEARHQETTDDLADGVREALSRAQPGQAAVSAPTDPVGRLAARYNEIRWTMSSGQARTQAMSDVVDEMIGVLRGARDFDVESHLHSDDRGLRLAAAAYLYANPDPAWGRALAEAAVSEDKPFNEYWALKALREVFRGHCEFLDEETRALLQRRMNQMLPGTDRAGQIRKLLHDCPARSGGQAAV